MPCAAYRINDQMFCDRCGKQWDLGDENKCGARTMRDEYVRVIKEKYNVEPKTRMPVANERG